MNNVSLHRIIIITLVTTLLFSLVVMLYACRPNLNQRHIIAVSIPPQRYLLEQIVGDRYDVVALLQEDAHPEQVESSINNVMAIEHCDAYFMIGRIGFEAAIMNRLTSNRPELKVCDTSQGIEQLHDSSGNNINDTHIWMSVRNARIIARNMLDGMIALDGKHKNHYIRNYNELLKKLDTLDKEISAKCETHKNEYFLVWRPLLSYFARDYGLQQIAVEIEDSEVTPERIEQVTTFAKSHNAKTFFYQKDLDQRMVETVNKTVKAQMVEFSPMNYSWDEEMLKIASTIANINNQ